MIITQDLYRELKDTYPYRQGLRDKRIYIAGKYTDETKELVEQNCNIARQYKMLIFQMGYNVTSPHDNYAGLEDFPYEEIMVDCFDNVRRCDGLFLIPNYLKSKGSRDELTVAKMDKIQIFKSLHQLYNHKWNY